MPTTPEGLRGGFVICNVGLKKGDHVSYHLKNDSYHYVLYLIISNIISLRFYPFQDTQYEFSLRNRHLILLNLSVRIHAHCRGYK